MAVLSKKIYSSFQNVKGVVHSGVATGGQEKFEKFAKNQEKVRENQEKEEKIRKKKKKMGRFFHFAPPDR